MPRALSTCSCVLAMMVGTAAGQNTQLSVVPVQGSVYMLVVGGANITIQVGNNGVLLVDTPPAALVPEVMTEIRKLSDKPLRYIINTSADPEHIGGNLALVGPASARGSGGAPFGALGLGRPAIVAHENVLNRQSHASTESSAVPAAALPTTTYFQPSMDFSMNGEPVVLSHQPAAVTDGDTIVHFRRSDVVSTGDVFTPDRYPVIDVQRGGSVQGLVAALYRILAITVPESFAEGGTYVIPGHGRLSEEVDVAEYRDMIVIIRDRVQDMITRGQTLQQIKAAKPSRDYDPQYGGAGADAFVESIYRSLMGKAAGVTK